MKKYRVQFSFHTMGETIVYAENEDEAIVKANAENLSDAELLNNLEEDGSPFVEEI